MSQKDDTRQYVALDFERYHSGQMTEQEMHALEKAALDDPFLSDALEGYKYTTTGVSDIHELKNKLLRKGENKKIVWYKKKAVTTFVKVAAIFLLVASFSWLYYFNNRPVKNEIADLNEIEKEKQASPVNKMQDTVATSAEEDLVASNRSTGTMQQPAKVFKNKTVKPAESKKVLTYEKNKDEVDVDVVAQRDTASRINYMAKSSPEGYNALAGKMQGLHVIPGTTLKGRITDQKGNPVIFASVNDKKNKTGVLTNIEGSFAISTKDSIPNVEINATGFKTVTRELNNDSALNNIVLMRAQSDLAEVIVTGAFQSKRKQARVSPVLRNSINEKVERVTVTNALPLNGWQQFNSFMDDSLKTLQQLGPSSVSAEVVVTFNVNEKGDPVEIRTKKSLCTPCNEEAIRIIKNSAGWKLNNKRKKAIAVFRF